jgi:hypothetical protein
LRYKSAYASMRICIQEFNEEGKVVFDDYLKMDGQGMWTLPRFSAGRYVMRLIVKIAVIKSYVLKVIEQRAYSNPTSLELTWQARMSKSARY